MRQYTLMIALAFALIVPGCVSMPKPVNDAYLVEKTEAESAKLDTLEQSIIAKKKEKDKAQKTHKIAEQQKNVSEGKLKILEKQHDVLLDEEKLHEMNKDGDRLGETRDKIKENEAETKKANGDLKLNIAQRDDALAILELRKAELGALVAELSYEKAKIGNRYLLKQKELKEKKNQGKPKEEESFVDGLKRTVKGTGEETIDEKKYEDYLKKQQDNVKEKKEVQKKTAEKLAMIRKELEGPVNGGKKDDEKK